LKKKSPNYKVNIGFGLHAGSAIAGPLGSELKIDATYCGHDVTLASVLEGSSKLYNQKILFTGDFHKYLTDNTADLCRKIDRVAYSSNPTKVYDLYTIDCFVDAI